MLKASEEEIETVREYFEWQAPDLEVTFLQKVYSEAVLNTRHDVWDIHTNKDRWWVITGNTNLYSQQQFPNMDLALTFHIGLILRIPRTEEQQRDDVRLLPFGRVYEMMEEAGDAVAQAHNLAGYQAVGVRCRETLLQLIGVAQDAAVWTETPPQRANFRAWMEIIVNDLMPGETNKERRGVLKGALESAWTFANWLTHSKSATWVDAELAHGLIQHAISMASSLTHDHSIMTVPLRAIRKPGDPDVEAVEETKSGPPEMTEYFAYGSNMSTARLRARTPSAQPLGLATLPGHTLRFHKRSQDKSAKCDAFATDDGEDTIIGVLFSFDPAERGDLDKAEGAGKGYDAKVVTVINDTGRRRKVLTYLASQAAIDNTLKPYSWYKDHVLAGSKEHGLPTDYVAEFIDPVEAVQDPDRDRDAKERATLLPKGP